MEVSETPLPGVGIRYDLQTEDGMQLGVLSHHTGRRQIVVFSNNDPDQATSIIDLTNDEAETIGQLLGATRITGALQELQQHVDGLTIDWIHLKSTSPFINKKLGDTQARSKTGSSIVAVIREKTAIPSPEPNFIFFNEDIVVVVGTATGVQSLRKIMLP